MTWNIAVSRYDCDYKNFSSSGPDECYHPDSTSQWCSEDNCPIKAGSLKTNRPTTLLHEGHKVASITVKPGTGPYKNDFDLTVTLGENHHDNGQYYLVTKGHK